MPTQGSFFGNFLAAFRAQSQVVLPKAAPSVSSSAAAASTATIWTAASPPQLTKSPASGSEPIVIGSPKPVNPKTNPYNSNPATSAANGGSGVGGGQDRFAPLQHNVSPQTHLPRSPPSSPGLPVHGPANKPQPSYPSVQDVRRSRRGSDSSSEGFREVKGGGEKWFIGGLTANGEERYYKLSMIKRDRSADRISTDQLSL